MSYAVTDAFAGIVETAFRAAGHPNADVLRAAPPAPGTDSSEFADAQVPRAYVSTTNVTPPRSAFSQAVYSQRIQTRLVFPIVDRVVASDLLLWAVLSRLLAGLRADETLGGAATRLEWSTLSIEPAAEIASAVGLPARIRIRSIASASGGCVCIVIAYAPTRTSITTCAV